MAINSYISYKKLYRILEKKIYHKFAVKLDLSEIYIKKL